VEQAFITKIVVVQAQCNNALEVLARFPDFDRSIRAKVVLHTEVSKETMLLDVDGKGEKGRRTSSATTVMLLRYGLLDMARRRSAKDSGGMFVPLMFRCINVPEPCSKRVKIATLDFWMRFREMSKWLRYRQPRIIASTNVSILIYIQ
jgi:hypothetical protein